MILWLPLQGYAALTMPFCKHGFRARASEHMTAGSLMQAGAQHVHYGAQSAPESHQQHAAHAGMHHPHDSAGGLACNDCGVCHLACSPAALSSPSAIEPIGTQSFWQSSPTFPPPFVPEQRTPPPLAAIT
jgi:ferredoxin